MSSPQPVQPAGDALTSDPVRVAEPDCHNGRDGSSRMAVIPAECPDQMLASLEQELARLQRAARIAISAKLNQLAGQSMGSIQANRKWVTAIGKLLDAYGLRVRCCECGHPAILRISPRGASHGVFVFDHTIDGRRTFHGGKNRMPEIHLVAKPPRRGGGRSS